MTEPEDKTKIELNDKAMRLIGIPFFGIFIPNVTGLFGPLTSHDLYYWLGYVYFITLAALIWQGNRFLLFRTRKRFTWFDKPIEKLILLFVNNIFYTSPLTISWLCLWYRLANLPAINWEVIQTVTLINVICVLFVTHVYETVFMVKEQQSELIRNTELSRAKAEAELEALKNQIDPHFIFNSLNSLSYLISTDPAKARLFTDNLAEVFRYILTQKDQSLVLLEDEFHFMNTYAELLEIRFGKALAIRNRVTDIQTKAFLIPPVSAFVGLENTVKHNEISEHSPLLIHISIEDEYLVIRNTLKAKRRIQHSSKIGLKNLDDRFRIILGKGIYSGKNNEEFTLRMPLATAL